MKYFLCWCFLLIALIELRSSAHIHKRFTATSTELGLRSKTKEEFPATEKTSTTELGLAPEDKEELQEALQLLNMGKKSLNLPTEDTQLLIDLVDASNGTDRSDEIRKFVEEPFDDHPSTNEKQYMALSGDEGRVNVNNYSVVTPAKEEETSTSRNGDIEDVFKMVIRKKVPGSKDNAVHKITIVETNKIKPLSNVEAEAMQLKRKKRVWPSRNSFYVPIARQKRTKDDPLLRFLKGEFSKSDVDEMFSGKVSPGGHTVKTRDMFNGTGSSERNSRLDKSQFGGKSPFTKTYLPWTRPNRRWASSQTNPKRREVLVAMKDTSNHRKPTVPLSNPTDWVKPPKYMPWMGEGNKYLNEDVGDIDYIFKNGVYKHSIPSISAAESQFFPRAVEIRPSNIQRSNILEESSIVNSKPHIFSQSPTTASSTTSKNEKADSISDVAKLDKTSIAKEKSIRETTATYVLEPTIIVFIVLLCIVIIVLAYSTVFRKDSHPQEPTLSLKGAHVTVNLTNDGLRTGQLPFRSHSSSSTLYKKLVDGLDEELADDFDFPDFEWQSETGEWLCDKGNVRNAIGFEQLP